MSRPDVNVVDKWSPSVVLLFSVEFLLLFRLCVGEVDWRVSATSAARRCRGSLTAVRQPHASLAAEECTVNWQWRDTCNLGRLDGSAAASMMCRMSQSCMVNSDVEVKWQPVGWFSILHVFSWAGTVDDESGNEVNWRVVSWNKLWM
eukprot:6491352-Amphidinium_carterae.1